MNDRPVSPTDAGDDWLDAVLRDDGREHRAEYLDDERIHGARDVRTASSGHPARLAQAGAGRALDDRRNRRRRGDAGTS